MNGMKSALAYGLSDYERDEQRNRLYKGCHSINRKTVDKVKFQSKHRSSHLEDDNVDKKDDSIHTVTRLIRMGAI